MISSSPARPKNIRSEGRAVHALLILLKNLTAHARWIFIALLIFYAVSGIRTIQPQEQALVLRFGKLSPQVHGPGLIIGLPEPFDRVLRFETGKDISITLDQWSLLGNKIDDPSIPIKQTNEQLTAAIQKSEKGGAAESIYVEVANSALDPVRHGYSITGDFNIIQGKFVLRYRIEEPFLFASAGDQIHSLLEKLAYRAITHQLVLRKIDQSLTSDRKALADAATRSLQVEATRLQLGVRIAGLDIAALSPPSQVLAAFEDVTNARQSAKTMFENSRQYEAEMLAQSDGEAGAILSRAQGYAANITSEATGETLAFTAILTEYHRDPELISRRILRETLDSVMGSVHSSTLLPVGSASPSITIEPAPQYAR